jgi:hypothetical protein
MTTEEIFQQVMDENCKDPLHRFAELVRADEREKWDTSDMAHRPSGLSVEQEKLCKYCGGIGRVVCDCKCMPEQAGYDKLTVKFGERAKEYLVEAKKSWIGMSDMEVEIYSSGFSGTRLVREIVGLLKERNT